MPLELEPVIERVPFVNPDWFKGMRYFGGYGRGDDPPPMQLPFGRVGVLISGRGSNLQSLIDAAARPGFPAEIALVISNIPDVYGLERAKLAGIPTRGRRAATGHVSGVGHHFHLGGSGSGPAGDTVRSLPS